MAIGDITIFEQASMTGRGSRKYNVAAGATIINPGEPVAAMGTGVFVLKAPSNFPVAGSDYFVGIAATTSTNTTSTYGSVGVYPINPGVTCLIKPNSATAYANQGSYDALVGKRVLIDLTTGAYTVLSTNSAVNGVIVEALDVITYPGQVAISFRAATTVGYTSY